MVNSILELSANADDQPRAIIFSAISKKWDSSRQTLQKPFTTSKTSVNGNKGNDATVKILETSWRKITPFKYNNYKKHWLCYFKTMATIGVTHVLDLLIAMFDKGHGCSMCYNSCAYTSLRFFEQPSSNKQIYDWRI